MKTNRLAVLAWTLAGLSILLTAAALWVIWLGRASETPAAQAERVFWTLAFLTTPFIGGLIAARQPRNPYGWVWIGLAVAFSLLTFTNNYARHSWILAPGSLPFVQPMLLMAGWARILFLAILPFTLLLFPTGWLPSPGWRFLVWVVTAACLLGLATSWAKPLEGVTEEASSWSTLSGALADPVAFLSNMSVLVIFISILLSIAALLLRFRRAQGMERQQLKWFVFGAVVLGLYLNTGFVVRLTEPWESLKGSLVFNLLPVMVGVAILRHRLFDIDIIIRRTLVYSVLTAILALIYFGGVALLQQAFRYLTGQAGSSQVAVVISTLVIAALFAPLRRRIQSALDRRFYRSRYNAEHTLQGFSVTLRDEVDLSQLSSRLVDVVDETLQPESVSLWLKKPRSAR